MQESRAPMRVGGAPARSGAPKSVTVTVVTAEGQRARPRLADETWPNASPLHAQTPIRPDPGPPRPARARTRQPTPTPADYLNPYPTTEKRGRRALARSDGRERAEPPEAVRAPAA